METVEFVKAIKQRVIENDLAMYQNILNNTDVA